MEKQYTWLKSLMRPLRLNQPLLSQANKQINNNKTSNSQLLSNKTHLSKFKEETLLQI